MRLTFPSISLRTPEEAKEGVLKVIEVMQQRLDQIKAFVPPLNSCVHCAGKGLIVITREIAPTMFSRMERNCEHCMGPPHPPDSEGQIDYDLMRMLEIHTDTELKLFQSALRDVIATIEFAQAFQLLQRLKL